MTDHAREAAEIANEWYRESDVEHAIRIRRRDGLVAVSQDIPVDIESPEFARWLTNQYRLAMQKGIQLARDEQQQAIDAATAELRRTVDSHERQLCCISAIFDKDARHVTGDYEKSIAGLVKQEFEQLTRERDELRKRLLTAAGDDLCRLSQEEIRTYSSGTVKIPPKEEFLASCERFHTQVAKESGVMSDCLTLAQLVAENERLRSERDEARKVASFLAGYLDGREPEELKAHPWLKETT